MCEAPYRRSRTRLDHLLADRSSVIAREIVHRPYYRAEAIVSTLVDAVMARPTNYGAIFEMVGAAKLRVFDVMGLSAFRKFVRGPARLTNPLPGCTGRTKMSLKQRRPRPTRRRSDCARRAAPPRKKLI
jgi:hypothetical protein